jgi:hypothetical protein
MASRTRSVTFSSRVLRTSIVAFLASGAMVSACSHDWDRYDPAGPPVASSSTSSTAASSSSTVTTATSSSTGAGGADGGGTGGGMGGGGTGGGGTGGGGTGGGGSGGSGGGVLSGKACVGGLIPLSDTFTSGLSTASWNVLKDPTRPVAIDDAVGLVSIDIPLGPITWGGVIVGSDRYDMRNCAVFLEAPAVPGDASVYMNLVIKLDPDKNFVEFTYQKQKLQFKYTINGFLTIVNACDRPYDAELHRYWRIRVNGDTTYWESSGDTHTWELLCSKKIPFAYENVLVGFGAGASAVAGVDAGASARASFDNFNVTLP